MSLDCMNLNMRIQAIISNNLCCKLCNQFLLDSCIVSKRCCKFGTPMFNQDRSHCYISIGMCCLIGHMQDQYNLYSYLQQDLCIQSIMNHMRDMTLKEHPHTVQKGMCSSMYYHSEVEIQQHTNCIQKLMDRYKLYSKGGIKDIHSIVVLKLNRCLHKIRLKDFRSLRDLNMIERKCLLDSIFCLMSKLNIENQMGQSMQHNLDHRVGKKQIFGHKSIHLYIHKFYKLYHC